MLKQHEIQDKVNTLLEQTQCDTYPVPIVRIAESLGYTVHFMDSNDSINDSIVGKVSHIEKKIYVKQGDIPQRQRFTIAHELGHIHLHNGDRFRTERGLNVFSDDHEEVEANRFAAMLLMPENEFRKIWEISEQSIEYVANYFAVSKLSASIRANTLNLLSL